MPQIYPLYYAPDLDNAWSVAPGAMATCNGMAPLQNGAYGSVSAANLFGVTTLTGTDVLHAQLFRQVDGSVRLLLFRKQNIDEYSNVPARTNRGTGYSASTADWSAAAWGNQIIACNYLDATQSSTGGAFSGLGGSSPKARFVAANINFVVLADVDDGGSNVFSDMVWWCGLRNPATWSPSPTTQAGNIRLLDAPGPIRAHIAYRDMFVAFKDNAIFVGQYTGPPFIFSWRLISNKVGCVGAKCVVELDGKLYFIHSSGFWEFDGQSLRNIGLPVFQSFLQEGSFVIKGTGEQPDVLIVTAESISLAKAFADDIEGAVWFKVGADLGANGYGMYTYAYNARAGKWGRFANGGSGANLYVRGSFADMQAFKADAAGRFWMIANGSSNNVMYSYSYPATPVSNGTNVQPSFTTGVYGTADGGMLNVKFYLRTLYPSVYVSPTVTINTYANERKTIAAGSSIGLWNTELDEGDVFGNSRFCTVSMGAFGTSGATIIAGAGFAPKGAGKR